KKQMDRLISVNIMFITEERVELAKQLARIAPDGLNKVIMGVTGSDANEFALKVAKFYKKGGKVLSFWRGFHGSTAGSAAATGKAENIQTNQYISELLPQGFLHAPPPYCYRCDFGKEYPGCDLHCLKFLENLIKHEAGDNLAAVMIEPIMAAGGVIIPPEGYLEKLRELCNKYDALLIFDEVVTGIGRTGKMFSCEHWGVSPDILVTGKALTGGYIPGSAVIMREDIGEFMNKIILHGHTHTAYPLMCCSALANLKIIERDDLCSHVKIVGDYFLSNLKELGKEIPQIGEIRGKGLLIGFEVVENKVTKTPDYELGQKLSNRFLEKGLIVELESFRHLDTSVIVFHPPLIIKKEHIDSILRIIKESFLEITVET
ncbi:MAG: aspartate aminotransferase family protein, partial [Spirochaetales bacterium]|nr:aspartate aminotransferase family protein [Spirochaetales bacterium]